MPELPRTAAAATAPGARPALPEDRRSGRRPRREDRRSGPRAGTGAARRWRRHHAQLGPRRLPSAVGAADDHRDPRPARIAGVDEPVYTHDGSIAYDDPVFAGDELYVSMTLVSTYDGRVLWHARDALDLEANNPAHVDRMVQDFMDTLPPALPPTGAAPRP